MKERYIIRTARAVSLLFTPFFFPVIAFLALFAFSYMRLLPLTLKAAALVTVFLFTVALPQLSIYIYRKMNGWSRHQAGRRERRLVPYMLSITSYGCCLYVMQRMRMPHFMMGIIAGALSIQVLCSIINLRFKISTHSAAAGGVIGALLAFSLVFAFNPVRWLCLSLVLAGAVGSSRIILRQHTLAQVAAGTALGFACGLVSVLYI